MAVGGGAAVLVLGATATVVVLTGGEGPPEDLTSLYGTDFATDPGWGEHVHDPEEDPHTSGYLPGEGQMMAYDPAQESDPWAGAVLAAPPAEGGELPPHLLVEADVRVEEGYDYLSFGIECTDQYFPPGSHTFSSSEESEHFATYRLSVRADGQEATLTRSTTDTDGREELTSGPVPDFEPYPALTGQERDGATNNLKLACESEDAGEGGPAATSVKAWVNDRLVAEAVDEEAVPEGYGSHELVRRQRIAYDRAQGEGPVRVLFENYHLYEIGG